MWMPPCYGTAIMATSLTEEQSGVGQQRQHPYDILVVDVEEPIQELLTAILSTQDYDVVCVSRGTEAAKLIKKLGFDLIITDIVMPGRLNGIDVLRITKETDPLCPVLAITGNFDSETVARLMSLGVEKLHPQALQRRSDPLHGGQGAGDKGPPQGRRSQEVASSTTPRDQEEQRRPGLTTVRTAARTAHRWRGSGGCRRYRT